MGNYQYIYFGAYIKVVHNMQDKRYVSSHLCTKCHSGYDSRTVYCPKDGKALTPRYNTTKERQLDMDDVFEDDIFQYWNMNEKAIQLLIPNTDKYSVIFDQPNQIDSGEYSKEDRYDLILQVSSDYGEEISTIIKLQAENKIKSKETKFGLVIWSEI